MVVDRVDLRSDTVTLPTPGMRQAMAEAELGDDCYGDDPTVNALQEEVAQRLGKEMALFVPSGTMANQLCLKAHTQPGDEVILHIDAHIRRAEAGAAAALAGVQFQEVGTPAGDMPAEQVEAAIRSTGTTCVNAPTTLICMENTHNFCGGAALSLAGMQAVAQVAQKHGLPLHLDGARLFNAALALDVQAEKITAFFDSGTLCFSKGLGAPVGSILYGRKAFVQRCLRFRKMYGGGMRQAGVLAAAARYALRHHVERLEEDHANARLLAQGLQDNPCITLPAGLPHTNLVFFSCEHPDISPPALVEALHKEGILIGAPNGARMRAVTHLGVSREGIEKTVAALHRILKG